MKAFLVMSLANLIMVIIYLTLLVGSIFCRLLDQLRNWIVPSEHSGMRGA